MPAIRLPSGPLGIAFISSPPQISDINYDSPLKDKLQIGCIVETLVLGNGAIIRPTTAEGLQLGFKISLGDRNRVLNVEFPSSTTRRNVNRKLMQRSGARVKALESQKSSASMDSDGSLWSGGGEEEADELTPFLELERDMQTFNIFLGQTKYLKSGESRKDDTHAISQKVNHMIIGWKKAANEEYWYKHGESDYKILKKGGVGRKALEDKVDAILKEKISPESIPTELEHPWKTYKNKELPAPDSEAEISLTRMLGYAVWVDGGLERIIESKEHATEEHRIDLKKFHGMIKAIKPDAIFFSPLWNEWVLR